MEAELEPQEKKIVRLSGVIQEQQSFLENAHDRSEVSICPPDSDKVFLKQTRALGSIAACKI